jgi:hypothetical protein
MLEQGSQHPDLGRAEDSPATEDECCAAPAGRHPWRCHDGILPPSAGQEQLVDREFGATLDDACAWFDRLGCFSGVTPLVSRPTEDVCVCSVSPLGHSIAPESL